ncbi:MAG TPA: pyrimidine 5'-nucleotidase [Anaerolineaceae bacterium]
MNFEAILFDLDETLYPTSSGIWELIRDRINLFMEEKLQIPHDQVAEMREDLFRRYGTTMRGLQAIYHIDEHEFLAFVHDVPVGNYLTPHPELRNLLHSLKVKKIIFTNADRNHASRVTNVLGISDCFDQVIDILDISPYCKPMDDAFKIAMRLAGISDPQRCVFIDDTPNNLQAAFRLGFYTVRVGEKGQIPTWNASIPSIEALPDVFLPQINCGKDTHGR